MRKTACDVILLLGLFPMVGNGQANGAGSTLAAPLYERWILRTGQIDVNYEPIGSEAGVEKFYSERLDFAGTDWPLSGRGLRPSFSCDAPPALSPYGVTQLPAAIGSVAIIYNVKLRGARVPLQFSPETLAGIFEGRIKTWNDQSIKDDNDPKLRSDREAVTLPSDKIRVVHRSDGSGTTRILSEYLVSYSDTWRKKMKVNFDINWPKGPSANGSEEMAAVVEKTPNSIGYVEPFYAKWSLPPNEPLNKRPRNLPTASVRNRSKNFEPPDIGAIDAAVPDETALSPAQLECKILDSGRPDAYPIASPTWLVIRTPIQSRAKEDLCKFLDFGLRPKDPEPTQYEHPLGQPLAPGEEFAPLTKGLAIQSVKTLNQICPIPVWVKVTPTKSVSVLPRGQELSLTFLVRAVYAGDTFRLAGSDGESFVTSVTPQSVSLPEGGSSTVSVTLLAPRSAAIGTSDPITLMATSATDPSVTNSSVQTLKVTRGDETPPVIIATAKPSWLWPPDGRLAKVEVSGTVTDDQSGVNLTSGSFAVTDQYGKLQPSGRFKVNDDGSFLFTVSMQASRNDSDRNGRHYTIAVQVADMAGNVASAPLTVVVPRDQPR